MLAELDSTTKEYLKTWIQPLKTAVEELEGVRSRMMLTIAKAKSADFDLDAFRTTVQDAKEQLAIFKTGIKKDASKCMA